MRIFLDQIGCRLNYSEMETLARQLRATGHQIVASVEQAQAVVFNTCAVTGEASRKSRQRIRQMHRANPSARIALTGCWSSLEPEGARALSGVSLIAHNSDKELLPALLEPWSAELDDPHDLVRMQPDGTPMDHLSGAVNNASGEDASGEDAASEDAAGERPRRTRSFIKVQDGCDNRCTFCIVTLARGESRSRPCSDIVDEIQTLTETGVQEAVLTGVHLGSYGRDTLDDRRMDLKRLVEAVLQDTDITRLRLSSLEPWELAGDFFDLWQRWPDRLCPHLHLPLQAGTDKQLRAMARHCTAHSYRSLAEEARAAIPDLVLTTDIIVGFPGETEMDFEQSLNYVEEMRFTHAHIFPFSARPGTAAAEFTGVVPNTVKRKRSRRMHEVVAQTGREERLRFKGTVRPVLWEGGGAKVEGSDNRLWTGLTDNYLRASVEAPPESKLGNTITNTLLTELHGETFLGTVLLDKSARE